MNTTETFQPTSRNTCPEPGCDEPRGDGFAGTCTEHDPDRNTMVEATDRDEGDACQAGTPGCCVDHSACDHGCETW